MTTIPAPTLRRMPRGALRRALLLVRLMRDAGKDLVLWTLAEAADLLDVKWTSAKQSFIRLQARGMVRLIRGRFEPMPQADLHNLQGSE